MSDVLYHLRRAALVHDGSLTDGQLLERFVTRREEAAFNALVRRHAALVWGVCRRVLGRDHDAEDAFQATFLVLVRKGATVWRREQIGPWLYGVAYRTALKARTLAARRRVKEAHMLRPVTQPEESWNDLRPLIDGELNRLPEKYRAALVLCDLEGKSRKEAARTLGWREGTLSGRLARARALLAQRLSRRGVTLSAAALVLFLGEHATAAEVPTSLVQRTVRTGLLLAAGKSLASILSSQTVLITEGVIQAMWWSKVRTVIAVLLGMAVLGTGVAVFAQQTPGSEAAEPVAVAPAAKAEVAEAAADDVSVQSMPPVIIKTVPQAGDTAVDAATKEIRVTFSKKMMDQSWSWSQISEETFPKVAGKIRYEEDGKTCVLPVQLAAGRTYVIWLNSERFHNFKDADNRPAVPYLLVFQTKE